MPTCNSPLAVNKDPCILQTFTELKSNSILSLDNIWRKQSAPFKLLSNIPISIVQSVMPALISVSMAVFSALKTVVQLIEAILGNNKAFLNSLYSLLCTVVLALEALLNVLASPFFVIQHVYQKIICNHFQSSERNQLLSLQIISNTPNWLPILEGCTKTYLICR